MLLKFIIKLIIMFSLMLLALGLEKAGAISYISRCFKTRRSALILWFIIACLFTAIIPDTMVAVIMLPIIVLISNKFQMDVSISLLVVAFGIVTGNDLTYFGGGDNIISRTLLEKFTEGSIDIYTWSNLFLVPNVIQIVVVFAMLYLLIIRGVDDDPLVHEEVSRPDIVPILFFMVACGLALFSELNYLMILAIAVVSSLYVRISLAELAKLPYKALYLWTGAMLLGNLLDTCLKSHAAGYSIDPHPALMLLALGITTNILTNTGLTSAALPTLMNLTGNNILVFVLCVKAIGLCYLTILANGCLAVASSYGLKQKDLFSIGIRIWSVLFFAFAIYFMAIW